MSVRIMNKGKASIQFGKTPEETFTPDSITKVDDDVAKKHLKLYPKILVDIDNASAGGDGKVKDLSTKAEKKAKKSEDDDLAAALKAEK